MGAATLGAVQTLMLLSVLKLFTSLRLRADIGAAILRAVKTLLSVCILKLTWAQIWYQIAPKLSGNLGSHQCIEQDCRVVFYSFLRVRACGLTGARRS